MIIKDIRLINFGKFHDTEIHFEREKPAEKIHIPNMNHGLILKYIVE